ncbi:MAG: restriction endonuclease subunit S [Succinatimonas sp.]|nr:restriction endonuclease subunit S [Succinatimonas sp.]
MSKHKISDFLENYGDGIHGTPNYDENGTVYFINGNNLVNGKIQINANTLKITEEEANKIKRDLNEKTLLLSINGTLGNIALYNHEKITLGKSACFLNVKEEKDKIFLKYVLSTKEFKKYMQLVATGSTIKNLAPSQVANYEFELKDNVDKYKVSNLLSSIDNKIENNNKINAELESLAKTIYDYWFLQFEFPNEEGKPYKSSGGKMVWNKELKREIPEGWAVKKLNSIANLYQPEILPSNLMKEDGKYFVYGANGIVGRYNKFNHEHPEIAICCRGASCGNYLMTLPKSWITGNSMVVTPKDSSVTKEYLYHSLRYIDIKRYVTGSAQPQITRSNLDGIKVVIPPFKSLEHFSNKAEKIRNELIKNINENNELSSLRDFLLPMLMNGQVQFK